MIINYYNYLKIELNFSNNSLDRYKIVIEKFNNYCNEFKLKITQISNYDLKIYLTSLYDLGYSKSSISNEISILKSFYNFLELNDYIKKNNTINFVYPKQEKKLPKILFEREVVMIINSIDCTKKLGNRNLALVVLMYSCGLRVSEISDINISDINFSDRLIIINGKGNKQRIVPVNNFCIDILEDYINNFRSFLNKNNSNYLFLNNKSNKISRRGIYYIINIITNKCSIKMNVSPHVFRHSLASHLLNSGMDIRIVQEILGHSNLSSTQIYTHLDLKNVKGVYDSSSIRR